MKQFKIVILLCATSILLCACPDKTEETLVCINNKSDRKIAFQVLENKQDEIFYCSNIGGKTVLFEAESNTIFKLDDGDVNSSWNSYLESLTIFILDGELYDKHWQQPCDTIRKYVPILHCYQLTLEDLQRMNWTVVYPPEE